LSEYAPVDEKNYSIAEAVGEMTYTIIGSGKFNTLAIGAVVGDTITAIFKDPQGNIVFSIIDKQIINKLENDDRHEIQPVTDILYCIQDMIHGSTVDITIKRADDATIRVGSLILGLSLRAGFTNLKFTNSFKDFSPTETDPWGNVSYIAGMKINVYKGTVDVDIEDYDFLNRTMMAIGGKTAIINGSGELFNEEPDNAKGNFFATMLIGRMKGFALKTMMDGKRFADYATYSIIIEEIV